MRNRKRIEWESKTGWNHKVAFQNETTEIEVCRKEYEKKKYYERGKGRGRKQADRVKKVVKAKRKSRKEEVQLAMLHVQNKIGLNN